MGAEGLGPGPLAALEKLQKLDGAVSRVARGVGKGDLPTVQLSHGSGATCEVYLHGATVARYAVSSFGSLTRDAHGRYNASNLFALMVLPFLLSGHISTYNAPG